MKELSRDNLARILTAVESAGVSIDSRNIQPGQVFFAIKGENFDGADFVSQARERGASFAIVNENFRVDGEFRDKIVIKTADTVKALGQVAKAYRERMGFKVVAITGSVGKTSTKLICYHVLRKLLCCYCSPRSFNNNIGVPLTLLGAPADTQVMIVELGSNRPGEIAELAKIAKPDIAVVTNIYPAHLEGFGSIENIAVEKFSIAEGLQANGIFIINKNLEHMLRDSIRKTLVFDSKECSDVKEVLPLAGKGNLENAAAACAICREFGISNEQFTDALVDLPQVEMRAQVQRFGRLIVINDCYNANPASMENALSILAEKAVSEGRRMVFVCGDMAELGGQSKELHRQLGIRIAETGVKVLLTAGVYANIAAKQAAELSNELRIGYFENTSEVCKALSNFITNDDIVLVKGSRTAGLEKVIARLSGLFGKEK